MTEQIVDATVDDLHLEEKVSLLSGAGFWDTKAVRRDGTDVVAAISVADGPHGLRKQTADSDHLGHFGSLPATCFPPAVTLASTWDPQLARAVGTALGREARTNEVSVLLGPGVNIKRSPLCGRNFEYFSEDPYLTGELATAMVAGIQSQGVGASLKHFAVNNQETDRMRVSADVDERTMREIYLAAFERVVTGAQPWTVMCSYNRINGVYASQDPWLLTRVLRDEWGFEGLVVSDWGAVQDRVQAVRAGLDLQMPFDGGLGDAAVLGAVRGGELDEALVDACVRHVVNLVHRSAPALADPGVFDADAHHDLARGVAAAGTVLIANDEVDGAPLLPLARDTRIAVVGEFARTPRYQGAGSSQVNPSRLDDALSVLREVTGSEVPFAAGYTLDADDTRNAARGADDSARGAECGVMGAGDALAADRSAEDADLHARGAEALRVEAVRVAVGADTVLVFLGLPAPFESEGFDRTHLDLPSDQIALLEAVAAVNHRIVVVLSNGSAVSIAGWRRHAPAVVESWLGGQGGGRAIVDVLTGVINPSGRLAETIPLRLEDTPAFGNFPGEFGHVRYGEGLLVGYRWYDTRGIDVDQAFGHGLSYTTFDYGRPTAVVSGAGQDVSVLVTVTVTNTGARPGAEVVQVYVRDPQASVLRPDKELKGFAKVFLDAGESTEVTIGLDARSLAFWHPTLKRFVVEGGVFEIGVGASSRDLRGWVEVLVEGEDLLLPLTWNSTVGEAIAHPVVGGCVRAAVEASGFDSAWLAMLADIPLPSFAGFGLGGLDRVGLAHLMEMANDHRQ